MLDEIFKDKIKFIFIVQFLRLILRSFKYKKHVYMKKNVLWIISALFLFVSCQKEKFLENRIFQDGKCEIKITGEKDTKFSSWNVAVYVKAHGFEDGSLHFEIFNDQLKDNITYNWTSPNEAIILFNQTDGVPRKFLLKSSSQELYLGELK